MFYNFSVPTALGTTLPPLVLPPVHTGSHVSVNLGGAVHNVAPVGIASGGPAPVVHVNVPGPQVPATGTISTGNQGVGTGYQGFTSGSGVHFNILQGPSGLPSKNPDSHHSVPGHPPMSGGHVHLSNQDCIGPACSAKNGFNNSEHSYICMK